MVVKIWISRKLQCSVTGTEQEQNGDRMRMGTTVVTTLALCTSCSQANNEKWELLYTYPTETVSHSLALS